MDHTAHLAAEETLDEEECFDIKYSFKKGHAFVEKQKQSNLAAEGFLKTMVDAGDKPLSVMMGTNNR